LNVTSNKITTLLSGENSLGLALGISLGFGLGLVFRLRLRLCLALGLVVRVSPTTESRDRASFRDRFSVWSEFKTGLEL
jgi:hypothetical protein